MYFADGRGREDVADRTGYLEPVSQVFIGFFPGQRLQVVATGNALGQLAHVVAVEHIPQLRLTDQYDLQQLLFGCLQIGEQAHLFQHVGA